MEDGSVVEETFWSKFAMPLAHVTEAKVEWIPYRPAPVLVLVSKAGNTMSIAVSEDTEQARATIGQYISGTPLERWLSGATREGLMLEGRDAR